MSWLLVLTGQINGGRNGQKSVAHLLSAKEGHLKKVDWFFHLPLCFSSSKLKCKKCSLNNLNNFKIGTFFVEPKHGQVMPNLQAQFLSLSPPTWPIVTRTNSPADTRLNECSRDVENWIGQNLVDSHSTKSNVGKWLSLYSQHGVEEK